MLVDGKGGEGMMEPAVDGSNSGTQLVCCAVEGMSRVKFEQGNARNLEDATLG